MGGDGKWVRKSKAIPNDEADLKAKINGRARADKAGRRYGEGEDRISLTQGAAG